MVPIALYDAIFLLTPTPLGLLPLPPYLPPPPSLPPPSLPPSLPSPSLLTSLLQQEHLPGAFHCEGTWHSSQQIQHHGTKVTALWVSKCVFGVSVHESLTLYLMQPVH